MSKRKKIRVAHELRRDGFYNPEHPATIKQRLLMWRRLKDARVFGLGGQNTSAFNLENIRETRRHLRTGFQKVFKIYLDRTTLYAASYYGDLPLAERLYYFKYGKAQHKSTLQRERRKNKALTPTDRFYYDRNYPMVGGVRLNPGTFIEMSERKHVDAFFSRKMPWSGERFISVEMEMISKISDEDLAKVLYKKNKILAKKVHIKGDSSIAVTNNYPNAIELVVTDTSDAIKATITDVCAAIKGQCRINKSCGLHVHIDMRHVRSKYDETYRVPFWNLVSYLGLMCKVVPKSRLANNYCNRNKSKDWIKDCRSRYQMINQEAFDKFKTIEVRVHAGTVDDVKINHWIDLLMAIVSQKDRLPRAVSAIKTASKKLKLNAHLTQYLEKRAKLFGDHDLDSEESTELLEAIPF